jgi:hypothetical protein
MRSHLVLKVLATQVVLGQLAIGGAFAADVIHVKSARYGAGSAWLDATDRMRQECEGKPSCSGALWHMFKDIAPRVVKTLEVSYDCGTASSQTGSSQTGQTYDFLNWTFSCPPAPQPTVRVDARIDEEGSGKPGDRELKLPAGYRFCFDHKYDWSEGAASDSSAKPTHGADGQQDGIALHWEVKAGATGNGSVHQLWSVVGALPGADCPKAWP